MRYYNVLKKTYPNGTCQYTLYHYPITYDTEKVDCSELEKQFDNINFSEDFDEKPKNDIKNMLDSDRRALKKIYDYARSNAWEYFITLTFSSDVCNRYSYDDVIKKLTTYLRNLSYYKCDKQLKYLLVPELHSDGAIHFHGFFSNLPLALLSYTGKTDSAGRSIFRINNYKLGASNVTKISDSKRAATYICKYVTKGTHSILKNKKHYLASRNLDVPRIEKMNNDVQELFDYLKSKNEFSWGTTKSFVLNGQNLVYDIIEMNESEEL